MYIFTKISKNRSFDGHFLVIYNEAISTREGGNTMNMEEVAMNLIVRSGDARSSAFQALAEAKKGNFDKADELMKLSKAQFTEAHHAQTDLLSAEAQGDKLEINVLLIHSQDHLMTSMLAQELIEELIYLHKTKADK